jgi:hypothetical protein
VSFLLSGARLVVKGDEGVACMITSNDDENNNSKSEWIFGRVPDLIYNI